MKTWLIIAVINTSKATVKLKPDGAALYLLNYQAHSELITLWPRYIPVNGDDTTEWIDEILYIWTEEKLRYEDMGDDHRYVHNFSSSEIKAWKKTR